MFCSANSVRIFHVQPFFKFPIEYSWNIYSRHSHGRLLLGIAQGLISWQITLAYNSDRGIDRFNPANLLAILGYAMSIAIMYWMNARFFASECSSRHVLFWHIGMVVCVSCLLAPMVYPTLDAMYIIFITEVSCNCVIYVVTAT